jgi:hypothetical protein
MWFDAVDKEDRIGRGGVRIKVDSRTVLAPPNHNCVHRRQNGHVNFGFRDTEMSKELDLTGHGGPTVRTHCRYDKRLCPCVSKPLTSCANHSGEVTDTAAARCDRDPHARLDYASQSGQLASCGGCGVILGDRLEDLTHGEKARKRRCESETPSGLKRT